MTQPMTDTQIDELLAAIPDWNLAVHKLDNLVRVGYYEYGSWFTVAKVDTFEGPKVDGPLADLFAAARPLIRQLHEQTVQKQQAEQQLPIALTKQRRQLCARHDETLTELERVRGVARTEIELLQAQLQQAEAEQEAALAVLRDPQKWMRWCDVRVLEANEALTAQFTDLQRERAEIEAQLREATDALATADDRRLGELEAVQRERDEWKRSFEACHEAHDEGEV